MVRLTKGNLVKKTFKTFNSDPSRRTSDDTLLFIDFVGVFFFTGILVKISIKSKNGCNIDEYTGGRFPGHGHSVWPVFGWHFSNSVLGRLCGSAQF